MPTVVASDDPMVVDAGALDRMREDAVLVNTGRGGLVGEAALADALREGDIAAAGLAALPEEPPGETPLATLENCVLTPHAG
ncbi:MAG: NAD(P)-dependent oxidoreductase [Haloarculaceae archaeon]